MYSQKFFTIIFSFLMLILLQGCLENSGNTVSNSSFTTNDTTSGLTVADDVISLSIAGPASPGSLLAADYVEFKAKEDDLGNPASNGMLLTSTSAGVRSWVNPNSFSDASTVVRFTDDFLTAAPAAATSFGEMGWMSTVSGTAAACAASAVGTQVGNPGQLNCTVGTTATGRASISTPVNAMALGGGEIQLTMVVKLSALIGGGQTYAAYFGLADNSGAGNAVDGVYFSHESSSANWLINTANNSTRTTQDSGIAIAADTWTKLQVVVNADGDEATFLIDGVEAGNSPIIANLPGSGRDFGLVLKIEKTVGVTARTFTVDYVQMVQNLTTAR